MWINLSGITLRRCKESACTLVLGKPATSQLWLASSQRSISPLTRFITISSSTSSNGYSLNLNLTKLVGGKALGDALSFVRFVPNFSLKQVSHQNALPREVVSQSKGVFVLVALWSAE